MLQKFLLLPSPHFASGEMLGNCPRSLSTWEILDTLSVLGLNADPLTSKPGLFTTMLFCFYMKKKT